MDEININGKNKITSPGGEIKQFLASSIGIANQNEKELDGARKVLNAAALTYVAAFITSLMTLIYWAFRLGLIGGRRD